jgi:hypothetical protein
MKKYFLLVIILSFHVGYGQSWVKSYESVDDWSCGLAKVYKDQKVGFVNSQGKLIAMDCHKRIHVHRESRIRSIPKIPYS